MALPNSNINIRFVSVAEYTFRNKNIDTASYPLSAIEAERIINKNIATPVKGCTVDKLYQCSVPRKWGTEKVYTGEVFGQTPKYLFITDGTLRYVNGILCMKIRLTPYFLTHHYNNQYWQVRYIPVKSEFIKHINEEYPCLNKDVIKAKSQRFDKCDFGNPTEKVDIYANGMRTTTRV